MIDIQFHLSAIQRETLRHKARLKDSVKEKSRQKRFSVERFCSEQSSREQLSAANLTDFKLIKYKGGEINLHMVRFC